MDTQIKQELAACFCNDGGGGLDGALSCVKKHQMEMDFDDDSDMKDMIEIILRALKLDENNIEFVKLLISLGFDINYKLLGDDCLLLGYMRDAPKLSVIKALAALGADIYSETLDGDNVLSILSGQEEALAVSMAEQYDFTQFDRTDKLGATPLMYAAMNGYGELAALLLRQGFDVNATGCAPATKKALDIETDGVSPLALAIRFGHVEMVRLLLAAGADEMLYDAKGNPPIFSLIQYPVDFFRDHYRDGDSHPIFEKKREIVSLLGQIDLTDADGYTVLMKSLFPMHFWFTGHGEGITPRKNLPVALALIEKGADADAVGNDGKRPLHQAVVAMEEVARKLLAAGADLNAQDNEGNTPLLYACMEAKEETVLWLLKAGADFKLQNNEGKTAEDIAAAKGYSRALELMGSEGTLLYACKNNQKRAVQVLLKRGSAGINERDEAGNTPLIYACKNNAPDLVRLLLEHGADTSIGSQANRMPLHFAAELGNAAVLALLVRAGADVNCADNVGVTPLMLMARYGKTAAALSFIKNPALDVNAKDNTNRTALDYATFSGAQELVRVLLQRIPAGADAHGNTTLHYACHNGQSEIVKILIKERQGDIQKPNDSGETPLMLAVRKSNLVIVKLLLALGVGTGCANLNGLIPLHMAAYNGDVPIGKELHMAGTDINAKTADGQTPLMYAIISGRSEFAELLLSLGADVNAIDNDGHSALYYATEAGLPAIVEKLILAGADG